MAYDIRDALSIERYAKKLEGKTFYESFVEAGADIHAIKKEIKENKGHIGRSLEEHFFKYPPNSSKEADFAVACIELKTSPLKILKNKKLSVKERMVMNIINYETIINEEWATSSFLDKNAVLLIVFYIYEQGKEQLECKVKKVIRWKLPDKDLKIIEKDWNNIVEKIKKGKAHELSEGDTIYLGACTKGSNSLSLRKQPKSPIMAMQRAFSLKPRYIRSILMDTPDMEPLIKKSSDLPPYLSFEDLVLSKIKAYENTEIGDIHSSIGTGLNPKAKNYYASLAARMLGLKSDKIEEFEKGEIEIKAIRLRKNGTPKEDVSFPSFDYNELFNENWEDSEFLSLLEKKFFFMVFKYDNNKNLVFKKGMFWNMPAKDIEESKKVWEEMRRKISVKDYTNISKKFNNICHVRPHGRNSKDVTALLVEIKQARNVSGSTLNT